MKNNYKNIEKEMVTYKDLLNVPVQENGELFVKLDSSVIPCGYQSALHDMEAITGSSPLVREGVRDRLIKAQALLKKRESHYTLFLTYGYRSLEVQTSNFLTQLVKTAKNFFPDPVDLYEEVHRYIAVPTVAGHPTGGAIDIIIKDERENAVLDFGAMQYDFSNKDCYVFSPNISDIGKKNRSLLRSVMIEVGFAPFDGEWWHFSYGDREWAFYYKKPHAIYLQKNVIDVMDSINKSAD